MTRLHARTAAEVAEVAAAVRGATAVAFDTEFLWEKTYWPRLCLAQVAVPGLEATLDPLAGADLTPLWEALVGGPTVVVHAGLHDMDILHREIGAFPAAVFDTQVAAAFLGYGDSMGYGNLVGAALGRRVKGGEGYTDWSRRPLHPDQIDYALEDVRHLLDLGDALADALDERGRRAWAGDEMARRLERAGQDADPAEAWRRVSDARKLKGRALAILKEVAAWREEEAMRADRSRQHVAPDRVLIEIARRAPTDPAKVADLRGLHPGQVRAIAGAVTDAVSRAIRLPESAWPRWPERQPFAGDPRIEAIGSVLNGVVRSRAADMDLAPGLLGTRSDLDEVVRLALSGELDSGGVPLLGGWRRDAVGEELLRVLRGEVAIRIAPTDEGPHLVVE